MALRSLLLCGEFISLWIDTYYEVNRYYGVMAVDDIVRRRTHAMLMIRYCDFQ
jgi:hypothetical protein